MFRRESALLGLSRSTEGGRGRRSNAALLCVAAALAISVNGCKTTGGGVEPPKAFVAPDWAEQKISTLAFVGLAGPASDENDRKTAEAIVQQELRSSQTRFLVLPRETAAERAQRAGAKDDFKRLVDVWQNSHTVDQFLASGLCGKLGVDGLLVATLDDWKREKVDWQTEGTSFSEVGLELAIVGGKSGLVAWQASKRMRAESPVYHPGQSATGFFQSDPNGAQRQGAASGSVPDAPDIDPLAREVMASLMAAFPEAPAGAGTPSTP